MFSQNFDGDMETSFEGDFVDEPFFHAPVVEDGLFPSSGFAPLYQDNFDYLGIMEGDGGSFTGMESGGGGSGGNGGSMNTINSVGSNQFGSESNVQEGRTSNLNFERDFSNYLERNRKNYDSNGGSMSVFGQEKRGTPLSLFMNAMGGGIPMVPPQQTRNDNNLGNNVNSLGQGGIGGVNNTVNVRLNNSTNQTNHENKTDNYPSPISQSSPGFSTSQPILSPTSSPNSKENDDEGSSKKRPRKKRKKNIEELPDPKKLNNIEEIQNILVTFDSSVFDEYISKVSKYREKGLSGEETNLVKDIRRRIKNRESARKCRQNRKNKMESLEEKIKELGDETHQLQEDIVSYKKENICLAEEVKYLQNLINNNPVFSTIFQEYSNAPSEKREDVLKNSISSQSFFLLAVMFSFGIVFNVDSNGTTMPLLNRGVFRTQPSIDLFKEKREVSV